MKRRKICLIILTILIIALLLFVDIEGCLRKTTLLDTLIVNIRWIAEIIDRYSPLLIFLIVVFILSWVSCVYTLSLNNITIFGIELQLRNPDDIVKCNIQNYLSTKRSLFCINEQYDNFCEVFDSYHNIYEFLRKQLSMYENRRNINSKTHNLIIKMIHELNVFLTFYQSHFRKWIKWEEENRKENYIELSELQKEFPRYKEMIKSFKDINEKMICYAKHFDINIEDWINLENMEVSVNDSK